MTDRQPLARTRSWITAMLWLAVPFPTYCALVIFAQPAMYETLYGTPFGGTVRANTIGWVEIALALSAAFAIVVSGAILAAVSWQMAKDSSPIGGCSNAV